MPSKLPRDYQLWYEAWQDSIWEVIVTRSTSEYVEIAGKARRRKTDTRAIFQTWQAAHEFLKQLAKNRVREAEADLLYEQNRYATICALVEPEKRSRDPNKGAITLAKET